MSNNEVIDALKGVHNRLLALYAATAPHFPVARFETDWDSPCIQKHLTPQSPEYVHWQPMPWGLDSAFANLESALQIQFHDDIKTFYTAFWSDGIWGDFKSNEVSIIQVWNEHDFEMLQENMLGHLFAQMKKRLDYTFFIGCTLDDQIISLDNTTGQVLLEYPGKKPHRQLSDSLAQWLSDFTPSAKPYTP